MKSKRRLMLGALAVALVLGGLAVLFPRRHEQLYKVTVLPSFGATSRRLAVINDRGQIAGLGNVRTFGRYHLLIRDRDNGIKDLGLMDVDDFDINNAGQIAGTMIDPNGNKQAFFWDPNDGQRMLGALGRTESFAKALNNRGQVVGFSHRVKSRP
jgi:hypothetical protein